jgi:hypothetical protein
MSTPKSSAKSEIDEFPEWTDEVISPPAARLRNN